MPRARHLTLADKSIDACIAAIDVYNKPDFRYREEAFSILMFNAWELLLKARILLENGGNMRSIEVWEPVKKKDGTDGRRRKPKVSRSGSPITIEAIRAAGLVHAYAANGIDAACLDNLTLLAEVRDTCVHIGMVGPGLGKRIQEVGSASLRNFVRAAETWFDLDLSRYNFFLMPLAFHDPAQAVVSILTESRPAAKKLLEHIAQTENKYAGQTPGAYNVTLQIELRFLRTAHPEAIPVRQAADGIPVTLSEANVRNRWPWDFKVLTQKLRERYSDFASNQRYHDIRRPLEAHKRYCHTRLLDPENPRSGRKNYYSPNIVPEFDKHYTVRQPAEAVPAPAAAPPVPQQAPA